MSDTKLQPGKFADSNVVSLDAWRDRQQTSIKVPELSPDTAEEFYLKGEPSVGPDEFDAIIKRNQENRERMAKDRTRNNEGVKRSYRLKSRPKQ